MRDHSPCCSTHNVDMTCERYRKTHFVEVRPCCSVDRARMKAEALRTELIELIRNAAQLAEDTPCNETDESVRLTDCPSCSMPINICATVNGVITSVYADVEPLVDMILAHLQPPEHRCAACGAVTRERMAD